jgi:hypothetical protein
MTVRLASTQNYRNIADEKNKQTGRIPNIKKISEPSQYVPYGTGAAKSIQYYLFFKECLYLSSLRFVWPTFTTCVLDGQAGVVKLPVVQVLPVCSTLFSTLPTDRHLFRTSITISPPHPSFSEYQSFPFSPHANLNPNAPFCPYFRHLAFILYLSFSFTFSPFYYTLPPWITADICLLPPPRGGEEGVSQKRPLHPVATVKSKLFGLNIQCER